MQRLPDFARHLGLCKHCFDSLETQERDPRVVPMCVEPAAQSAASKETSVKQGTGGQLPGGIP